MTSLLAQITFGDRSIGWGAIPASLSLIAVTVLLAYWLHLGITSELLVASARAAVQLMAVGVFFRYMFTSDFAFYWAWAWVLMMVGVSAYTAHKRGNFKIKGMVAVITAVIAVSTAISLGVIFGLGVLEFSPVSLVVISGITIGNAVPAVALGQNRAVALFIERGGEAEALLSLGCTRRQVIQFMAPDAAKTALLPQIERTKIVGLIALPGAMTGLLLAGMNPIDAVIIQLLVMYLVLGTSAVGVISTIVAICRAAVTDSLRLADWTRQPA